MKRMTEEQLRDYLEHGSKLERVLERIGNAFRRVIFTSLSIVSVFVYIIFSLVWRVSCILVLPGIYYAYKTYVAAKSGQGLFYGGYFKISACFLIFPFIAILIAELFQYLHSFFDERAY